MHDVDLRRVSVAILAAAGLAAGGGCSTTSQGTMPPHSAAAPGVLRDAVVEASCGQCQLGVAGGGCDLAVRIDGSVYPVRGTGIDDHGDAHAADGLCNAIRPARVTGRIVDGAFIAERFDLLPDD